jgi:hypothetical protein
MTPAMVLTQYGSWTHPDNHHLSDTLLTIIEGSAPYKVAFGFDKGNVTLVPTGGKKTIDHYRAIARELFVDVVKSIYTEDDVDDLLKLVKNRITGYVAIIDHLNLPTPRLL